MSRPKLTLQEWCNDDQKIKVEFLKKESLNPHGLIFLNKENQLISKDQINHSNSTRAQLFTGVPLIITYEAFDKIKAKYRVLKKKLKDSNLITKNFKLTKQVSDYIRLTKDKNGWKREEDVIENMVNNIQNSEVNKKTITQLHSKEIKLATLNNEIKNNMMHIHQLSEDKNILTRESYEIKELLAAAYLKNDFYIQELKHNNISITQPNITEETIRKKLLEIEYARKSHI